MSSADMNATWIIFMVFAAVLFWVLSGWDSKVTGENPQADLKRRLVRCVPTLVLLGIGSNFFIKGGIPEGFICVLLTLPVAPFWVGCISEIFTRGFHGLVDSSDHRQFDARQLARDMDRLAGLVREGRYEDAINLCRQLRESSEVSVLAMETMLFQLYQEKFADERVASSPALREMQALREQKRFDDAAARLEALLKQEPQNLAAALLLMRVRAQDLWRADQALAVLQALERQSRVPPAFADFARRRIGEWSGSIHVRPKTSEGIESMLVDSRPAQASQPARAVEGEGDVQSAEKLLASGQLATAIELLESRVRAEPKDFDLWLKLAEAYGVNCRDAGRAGKVVDQITRNAAFSAEQIQLAKAKLKEWRSAAR